MPAVLEDHQQRAEDVKSGIQTILTRYSEVTSNLSSSCSSAIHDIAAFASSAFISSRHDEVEREKLKLPLQKAEYKNPVDDLHPAQPLLGVGPWGLPSIVLQVIESCNNGPGSVVWSVPEDGVWLKPAFDLERSCMQSDLPTLLSERDTTWKLTFMKALFWSDLPLITISDSEAKQYSGGISRGQMAVLLHRFLPLNTQEVLSMMGRILEFFRQEKRNDIFSEISQDLTHREDTENIIRSIWRKWDVANDSALPDGVERIWDAGKKGSALVWIKTGKPFTPNTI